MAKTQFFRNLEYFKTNLGVPESEFYTTGKGKDKRGIIPVSKNGYENYRKGTIPGDFKLKEIADALYKAILGDEGLFAKFPNPILPYDLRETDLSLTVAPADTNSQNFYSYKMVGAYICYYTSTNVEGRKSTHYGVIQMSATDKNTVMDISGVFSLKNYDEALKIHSLLNGENKLSEIVVEMRHLSLFTGVVYLKPSLMWVNLVNENQDDFVSVSFDLSDKILTKNPNKLYLGSRGIAISSTSGQSNQSAAFPLVITKKPLSVSPNELTKYLHFRYTKIKDEEVHLLAEEIITLLNSILNSNALSPETRTKLLATTLAEKLLSHLDQHIYNSHYFLTEEMTEFYDKIIFPIRENLDETDGDTDPE